MDSIESVYDFILIDTSTDMRLILDNALIILRPFTVSVGCTIILFSKPLVSVLLIMRLEVLESESDHFKANSSDYEYNNIGI